MKKSAAQEALEWQCAEVILQNPEATLEDLSLSRKRPTSSDPDSSSTEEASVVMERTRSHRRRMTRSGDPSDDEWSDSHLSSGRYSVADPYSDYGARARATYPPPYYADYEYRAYGPSAWRITAQMTRKHICKICGSSPMTGRDQRGRMTVKCPALHFAKSRCRFCDKWITSTNIAGHEQLMHRK